MNEIEKLVIAVSKLDNLNYKKQIDTIELCVDCKGFKDNITKLGDILLADEIDSISNELDNMDSYLRSLSNQNIKVITIKSDTYPDSLYHVDNPPLVLYAKGDVTLLNSERIIAIVGTRRITRYGSDVTAMFSKELSRAGFTIVSGLASGVDKVAHSECLAVGGKTIAVLGSGVNEIYPAENKGLYDKILSSGGLVISEYKPNERPKAYYFPKRNRIVAGLSQGVLITEATLKSGSMHTKNYALDYGKDLYVVPARITDIYSAGCNEIIKSLQGSVVLSPKDIMDNYDICPVETKKKIVQISINEQIVLDIVGSNDLHYEEILSKSNLQTSELNTLLMQMELKGLIESLGGNFYRVKKA